MPQPARRSRCARQEIVCGHWQHHPRQFTAGRAGSASTLVEELAMKIVVIGSTGLIGSKLVNTLRQRGHEVLAASPDSGVNTITGEGLVPALEGAQVVVDVSTSLSLADAPGLTFFETTR